MFEAFALIVLATALVALFLSPAFAMAWLADWGGIRTRRHHDHLIPGNPRSFRTRA